MLRKAISYLIILPLLFIPLFCCCHQEAIAATVGVEHCHDDEASSATHHDSKSDHDHSCDCNHELSTTLENFVSSHAVVTFTPNFFPETTFVKSFSVILLIGSMRLAYLGPPLGSATAVPLYTLHHSLRI